MTRVARGAVILGLGALGACSPPGELILAVHTDLSQPADIDHVAIEVRDGGGAIRFTRPPYELGAAGEPRLPFTLGLYSEEPGAEVHVLVSAWSSDGTLPRILREARTTIPSERTALLYMPLQFLCDGSGQIGDLALNSVTNTFCADGQTCVAGACVPVELRDSTSLPDYSPEKVFGGTSIRVGECFDTTTCFEGAAEVEISALVDTGTSCTFDVPAQGQVNIALKTEPTGEPRGTCDALPGGERCLVTLDADRDAGFQQDLSTGAVRLPREVCRPRQELVGKMLKVLWKPVSEACPHQKTLATPPCDP